MAGNDQSKNRDERPDPPDGRGTSHVSRRSLLGAAGAGAAGLAAGAFGIAAVAPAAAAATSSARGPGGDGERPDGGERVVVHVRSGRSGELDVFSGTSHTRVHDPALAARLRRTIR
jgi:hypothetical protein